MLFDCQKEIKEKIDALEVDLMTLRLLNSQSAAWEKDLQSEILDQCRKDVRSVFIKRSQIVDPVLGQLSYVDQLRLGLGRSAFDSAWEETIMQSQSMVLGKQTVKNENDENRLEQDLLTIVGVCAESITSRSKSQGEITIEYLGKRPSVIGATKQSEDNRYNIVGVNRITAPKFSRLQKDLNESFMKAIQISTSHIPSDADWGNKVYSLLARASLLSAVFCTSAAAPIGAVMAEAVDSLTAAAFSASLLTLGVVSFGACHSYTSRKCVNEWMSHADKLDASLDNIFKEVMRQVSTQLSESVAPYSRFVNGEGDHLAELQNKIDSSISTANTLRGQINKACDDL